MPDKDLVNIIAGDGTPVSFIFRDPRQGGVKDVYFSPDKKYVVAFFRKPPDPPGRDRINRIVGLYRKRIFEQVGGSYWKDLFCWPERVVEYQNRTGIVVPAYQSHFFFRHGNISGCEKEGKWFASAKTFNHSVPPEEKGTLLSYLRICLLLSRAVHRLHAAGLAHSDLSYKNCLIDPEGGHACIIDIDGLVVPGLFPPDVLGTPDFIAPEVVATMHFNNDQRKLPCRETDLHALAVLIYQYLFHRHPLRGGKVHSRDNDVQEKMEMGEKALFIEHPQDRSNRPRLSSLDDKFLPWVDVDRIPCSASGPLLEPLFRRAFIDGLHCPTDRPAAGEWVEALVKTCDMVQPCLNPQCVKKWFVFDDTTRPKCPCCGTAYTKRFPVLDFYSSRDGGKTFRSDNHRLMVYNGQSLYLWHADRTIFPGEKLTEQQNRRVGYFLFHQGMWLFVNQTLSGLRNISTDEVISPGKYVELTNGLRLLLADGANGRMVNIQIVNG